MTGTGFHLPKMSAARAMKPLPATMFSVYEETLNEMNAPARPASAPEMITAT